MPTPQRYICPNPDCQGPPQPADSEATASCHRCQKPLALNRQYLLLRQVGEGGMGTTYLAQDLRFIGTSNELCVLKQLKQAEATPGQTQQNKELLRREASRLLDLRHPGIPAYRDFFDLAIGDKSHFYMVQQFIDGASLQDRLVRTGPMKLQSLLPIMVDVLLILDYLHHQKDPSSDEPAPILHLDIKPANLMRRDKDDAVFLIDFGVATQMAQADIATAGGKASIHGFTPGFAPFEQTMGYAAPASDLYAWAMTFIVMLTGRDPRELIDPLEQKARWAEMVTLPPTLMSLLRQSLALQVKDRPASARELLQQLGSVAGVNAADRQISITELKEKQTLPSGSLDSEAHQEASNPSAHVIAASRNIETKAYGAAEAPQTALYDSQPTPRSSHSADASQRTPEQAGADDPPAREAAAPNAELASLTKSFPHREDIGRRGPGKRTNQMLIAGLALLTLVATNLLIVRYLSQPDPASDGQPSLRVTIPIQDRDQGRVLSPRQRSRAKAPSSRVQPRPPHRRATPTPTSRPAHRRPSSQPATASITAASQDRGAQTQRQAPRATSRPTAASRPTASARPVQRRAHVPTARQGSAPPPRRSRQLSERELNGMIHQLRFAPWLPVSRFFRVLKMYNAKDPAEAKRVYVAFLRRGSYDLRVRTIKQFLHIFPTPTARALRLLREALARPHLGRGACQIHAGALKALHRYAYKYHHKPAARMLLHTWRHDTNSWIRLSAMGKLSFLDKKQYRKGLGSKLYKAYCKQLKRSLHAPSSLMRGRVIPQLKHHAPEPATMDALGRIFLRSKNARHRREAASTLLHYCKQSAHACRLLLQGHRSRQRLQLRANVMWIYMALPRLKKHGMFPEVSRAVRPLLASAHGSIEVTIQAVAILLVLGQAAKGALPQLQRLQQKQNALFASANRKRRARLKRQLQRTIKTLQAQTP